MINNAMQLFDELEKSLEGLAPWEKEHIEIKFVAIPEISSLMLLDKKKNILLINTYTED